jgi:hypothetical protein
LAWPQPYASGDLSAPRRARVVGWARRDGAAWRFQIPLLQPRAIRRDRRTMADRGEGRSMRISLTVFRRRPASRVALHRVSLRYPYAGRSESPSVILSHKWGTRVRIEE